MRKRHETEEEKDNKKTVRDEDVTETKDNKKREKDNQQRTIKTTKEQQIPELTDKKKT